MKYFYVALAFFLVLVLFGCRPPQSEHRNGGDSNLDFKVPEFSFTAHTGEKFGSKDVEGKIWIAAFIFTSCPGICPKMTESLLRVQNALSKGSEVKIVTFSVDPETDTVEVLRKFAESKGIDSRYWVFLTGEKKKIYDLSLHGFKLGVSDSAADQPLGILHSDRIVLVGRDGYVVKYYHGTLVDDVDTLISDALALEQGKKISAN